MSDQTPGQTPDQPDRLPEPASESAPDQAPASGESGNPFDDLAGALSGGLGGLDLGGMLEQAQQMQSQMMAAQQELEATTVDGTAGGVTVQVSGVGEMRAVQIPAGSFDGGDADSLADLEDLVVAAYRDGKAKADALAQEKLGPMAGGLGGGPDAGGLGGGLGGGFGDLGGGGSPLGFGGPGGSGV